MALPPEVNFLIHPRLQCALASAANNSIKKKVLQIISHWSLQVKGVANQFQPASRYVNPLPFHLFVLVRPVPSRSVRLTFVKVHTIHGLGILGQKVGLCQERNVLLTPLVITWNFVYHGFMRMCVSVNWYRFLNSFFFFFFVVKPISLPYSYIAL